MLLKFEILKHDTNKSKLQYEKFKSRFNLWNIGYQSVQNVLSSSMLTRIITTEIYKIVTFLVVLYGCEN